MATFMNNITEGGAKKAFAGSIGAVLGSEVLSPIIDWGFDVIEAKAEIDIPDTAEVSFTILIVAAVGFLVSFIGPANNVETTKGLMIKPDDAKITKDPNA